MRAATTLVPSLQAAANAVAIPNLWRGDEWIHADPRSEYATTGFPDLERELPGGGWPQGQLVELLVDHAGIGELGLLLPALAAVTRAGRSCVWVLPAQPDGAPAATNGGRLPASTALPYAPALEAAGLDLARTIFVRPLTTRESGWALEQSLRAAHLGALVGWLPETGSSGEADFRSLRRLHLLAQRHRALVFILRAARHAQSPSPAALRLRLQHDDGQLQVQVLKRRGRPLLDPVAIQVHPEAWGRARTPAHAAPASAAGFAAASASLLQMVRSLAGTAPVTGHALAGPGSA